nr:MAG TPA: hypothetical protein [Caudoviricetes sp.]
MEKKIIAYKGFDKNLKCRGFQYEVGKEYEMSGRIACCERGFHACESPLEVFDHYDMLNSRFAKVEQSGEIDKEENSTKVCSSKIKVKAELKLADIINLGVEWIKDVTSPSKLKKETDLNDNGGDSVQIGSSGNSAKIGSSGDSVQIGSSGNSAKIGSSGDYAKIGSSGNSAKIGSSGDYAKIDSTGYHSVVMAAGNNSIAKAKIGSWITLSEWDCIDGVWIPICVKTEKVDGEHIKADTFYKLVNGEFKEVEE